MRRRGTEGETVVEIWGSDATTDDGVAGTPLARGTGAPSDSADEPSGAAECNGDGLAGTVVDSLEPDASSVAVLLARRRDPDRGTAGGPIGNGTCVASAIIIFDDPIAGGSCSSGGSRSDDECRDALGDVRREGVSRGDAGRESESPEYVRAGLPAVANVRIVNVPAGDARAPAPTPLAPGGPPSACVARPLPLTSAGGGLNATASSDSRKSCSETDAFRPPPSDDGESRSGIELVDGVGSDPHVSEGEPGSVPSSSEGSGEAELTADISSPSPAAAPLVELAWGAAASMQARAEARTTAGVGADADAAMSKAGDVNGAGVLGKRRKPKADGD